jgi:hypothetical protein
MDAAPMDPEFGYIFCALLARAHLYVGAVALELEESGYPHAILFEREQGNWSRWSMEHRLAGIAAFSEGGVDKLLCVGETGEVEIVDSEGADEERIGDQAEGPDTLRPLRCVRIVGPHAYAAGARRQVYRRRLDTPGWQAIDRGCVIARGSADAGSFHAIDGRDQDLLLAVGMGGALWRCAGGVWEALESPVSAALDCVLHLDGERFLAAGAGGVLLAIDGSRSRQLAHGATSDNFVGCAFAFGAPWLCTENGGLFRMDGETLSRVDTGLAPARGGGTLAYADALLVYVSDTCVQCFDGVRWTAHDPAAHDPAA